MSSCIILMDSKATSFINPSISFLKFITTLRSVELLLAFIIFYGTMFEILESDNEDNHKRAL